MHSCYNAELVYGLRLRDRSQSFALELYENFDLEEFATDVIRHHAGNLVYGVQVSIHDAVYETGDLGDAKSKVNRFVDHLKGDLGDVGMFMCVCGDYELCHDEWEAPESASDMESDV